MWFAVCMVFLESRKRFTSQFHEFLSELKKSQHYTYDEIESFKKEKISQVLVNAKASKLYPELDDYNLSDFYDRPEKILGSIPVMSKDQLIEKTKGYSGTRNDVMMSTSGTTGKALKLFKDKESIAMQWAIWFRHRSRFGISLGDTSVNFTGKPLVPVGQNKPPFWRYNAVQRQYLVSMQQINRKKYI